MSKSTSKSYDKRVLQIEKCIPHMEETNIRKVFGKFYSTPQGKLQTYLYLNIEEKHNELCVGQSSTTIPGSKWSLQRLTTSRFFMYPCTSSNPESSCTQHLCPALGTSPRVTLLPEGGSEVLTFQDGYKKMLTASSLITKIKIIIKKKNHSLARTLFLL